jgi:hypothetical protein
MTVPLGGGGVRRWWRRSVGRRLALTVPAAPEWRGGGWMRCDQIEEGEGRGWSSLAWRVGSAVFMKSGTERWALVACDGEWIAGGEDKRKGCLGSAI